METVRALNRAPQSAKSLSDMKKEIKMLKTYLITIGIISLITFTLFAVDKLRSKKESNSRIPELVLLSMIGFGGAAGGILGMYTLRHKTIFKTKFHFIISVWLALFAQAAIAIYLGWVTL